MPTWRHFCSRQYWQLKSKRRQMPRNLNKSVVITDYAWIYWLDNLSYSNMCKRLVCEYFVWKSLCNPEKKMLDFAESFFLATIDLLHMKVHHNVDRMLDLDKHNITELDLHSSTSSSSFRHCWRFHSIHRMLSKKNLFQRHEWNDDVSKRTKRTGKTEKSIGCCC